MIFDLYAVVRNFAVKVAHCLIGSFFYVSSFCVACVACVCNYCHRKNQNFRLEMGLTSHLSDAYVAFSSYCVYSSLLLSLMKMSLMTSLMMMVLGQGSPPVCAFLHFLNYLLIMLVDCHLM